LAIFGFKTAYSYIVCFLFKTHHIFSNISSRGQNNFKTNRKELNVSVSTVSKALNDSPD
jgi:hypothetical protein